MIFFTTAQVAAMNLLARINKFRPLNRFLKFPSVKIGGRVALGLTYFRKDTVAESKNLSVVTKLCIFLCIQAFWFLTTGLHLI